MQCGFSAQKNLKLNLNVGFMPIRLTPTKNGERIHHPIPETYPSRQPVPVKDHSAAEIDKSHGKRAIDHWRI